MKKEDVKKTVRERYGKIASESGSSCCGGPSTKMSSCCGTSSDVSADISKMIGYTDEELNAVPDGANLGLGCGNPVALASLKEGETVLDLGSGAGFDCFLAAGKVGTKGKIIGVDMTPEMLDKARENARNGSYTNVEFRLGEIENLPVADNSVDAIISNCVVNLSNDKPRVFDEAFRVLKPGGRLMVSDIVLSGDLPKAIMNSIEAYVGCVAGAMKKNEYLDVIKASGFRDVTVVDEAVFPTEFIDDDPIVKEIVEQMKITPEQVKKFASSIVSVKVSGKKYKGEGI